MRSGVTLATASNSPHASASSSEMKRFGMLKLSANLPTRPGSTSTAPTMSTPSMALKRRACSCAIQPVPRIKSRIYCSLEISEPPVRSTPSNSANDTAVDPDVLAGDVTGAFGRQEGDGRGDLFGSSIALHRHAVTAFLGGRQAVDP